MARFDEAVPLSEALEALGLAHRVHGVRSAGDTLVVGSDACASEIDADRGRLFYSVGTHKVLYSFRVVNVSPDTGRRFASRNSFAVVLEDTGSDVRLALKCSG